MGGTSDVVIISAYKSKSDLYRNSTVSKGHRTSTVSTTLEFSRKLNTGDKYDKVISLTEPNDMIYAWGVSDNSGLMYHAGILLYHYYLCH